MLGRLGEAREQACDSFSAAYLISVAARAIRDLAVLGWRSQRARKRLATFTLETEIRFASAADRTAFAEELSNTLARLTAKYHNERADGGRVFRFFTCGYPAITKQENDDFQFVRME